MDDYFIPIIGAIGAIVFVLITYAVVKASMGPKKALQAFVQSRGLIIEPKDEGGQLATKMEEKLGIPSGGIYKDIVRLPLSTGEAYLYTRYSEHRSSSTTGSQTGPPHHFITVFMDIPVTGRTFLGPSMPIGGGFGKMMVEFVFKRVFGAHDIHIFDVKDHHPHFAKVYNIFTEDEESARKVILSSGIASSLMSHPRKKPPSVAFCPEGFGLDIEPMIKRIDEMELFVAFAENLSRELRGLGRY